MQHKQEFQDLNKFLKMNKSGEIWMVSIDSGKNIISLL